MLGKTRVVLIGYPDVLASGVDRVALREPLGPLRRTDLRKFFLDVYKHLDAPIDHEVIDGLVKFSLKELEQPDDEFIPSQVVERVAETVTMMLEPV